MSIMVVISLFGIMLLTMLTRVVLPMGQKPTGTVLKQVSLPFRQRLLYHRTSIYLVGAAMILGGLGGWLSFAYQVLIVLAAFAIIGVRIRYTFTTDGVALNNVVFRQWSEFQEVQGDHRALQLKSDEKADKVRPFKILLTATSAEEVGKLVTKLVKTGGKVDLRPAAEFKTSRPAKKRKAIS